MSDLYLIGRSKWYAQWVTEEVMVQFAKEYYERLLVINRSKDYIPDSSNQWDKQYLMPKPVDVQTSIKYLSNIGMMKNNICVATKLTDKVWNLIVESDD